MSAIAAAGGRRGETGHGSKPKWGRFEWYVVALFLGSGLMFVPGMQVLRPAVRALPYAMSLAILAWHLSSESRRTMPSAGRWVIPALILYAVNVFHPLTDPMVGVATVAFHVAIVGPVFWAGAAVRDLRHFEKLLWLVLAAAGINVIVGILQAAFPYIFMPPQLSGHQAVIAQQTYMGPFGREIVRPPGLSDLPGGAAWAGAVAAIISLGLAVRTGQNARTRLVCFVAALAGLFVLYLTQIRSITLMTVLALVVLGAVSFVQGQGRPLFTVGGGVLLLVMLIGLQMPRYDPANPYAPGSRFQQILDRGLINAFMENRGIFLVKTFEEHLPRFPLGAGLGRWGMVREYFGRGTPFSQIWVEIQPTGWLLDGGVLMWILYGGALFAAMGYSLHIALRRGDPRLKNVAAIVLSLQVIIAGSGLAGPVFNTVFGILFWLIAAGLGAVAEPVRSTPTVHSAPLRTGVPVHQ